MKISVIQMNSQTSKADNIRQAQKLVADAVEHDRPDMVVLPEVWTMLGGSLEQRRAAAEEIPGGEAWRAMQEMGRTHKVYVHGGSMLEKAGKEYFNTTVAFDPNGNEIARYRKIHLFDVTTPDGKEYKESATVGRGDAVVTYQANGVTVGCSICYDLRFGELYRALAAKGAEVIMLPAAFTLQTGKDHWEPLIRARAIETETYFCAAAQVGSYPQGNEQRQSWGHSMIVDPWGHMMAQASDGPGFATARVDMEYLRDIRQKLPVHQHHVLKG
jgi:nitrilase